MDKKEMEKKRDLLALEKREPYNLEYRNIVGALFCAGWDACTNEYELRIQKLRQALKDINKEELRSQRPGGEYSKSARISYEALLADEK